MLGNEHNSDEIVESFTENNGLPGTITHTSPFCMTSFVKKWAEINIKPGLYIRYFKYNPAPL